MSAVWAEVEPPCTRHDPELFFPQGEPGRPGPDSKRDPQVERAKAICAVCPVRQDCLQRALDGGEDYGIWGGLTATERRALLGQPRPAKAVRGPREQIDPKAVQQLMTQGHSQPQIAVRLGVHTRSVGRIVEKLRRTGALPVGSLRPCGTHAAHQRHVSNGEEPCEPCKVAEREHNARTRRRQRAGAA